jgi:hypothetical protein
MRSRVLLGVVCAFALATVASAADAPADKSPWEGFGVGSWVHHKATTKMGGGGLSMPEEVEETRETVVRVTDDAHTIKREKKTATGWETTGESPVPRRTAPAPTPDAESVPKGESEDLGTEKVTVEGKAIECKKVRTKVGDSTTTTWTSAKHGVLKAEGESGAGGGKTTRTRTVTALAKKVTLAGKELVCRETKTFVKMELPGVPSGSASDGTTSIELESDAVPGRKVRTETTGTRGPVTRSSLQQLVAFEANPR